jgi:flavin reductase (DIM6/NTAB) family NADH-FMN oxidoreductase RutF
VSPDAFRYRDVMGRFASGVAIITANAPDGPRGLTVNALASLSLDPLLLLVCFDNRARTLPLVEQSGRFGVNVLRAGQQGLAERFASKLPEQEKFATVPHGVDDGVPVIEGVLAWLACDLRELVPGGDHTIGIGAVTAMHAAEEGEPLVFYRGRYAGLDVGSPS